jgi:hypothetical protein
MVFRNVSLDVKLLEATYELAAQSFKMKDLRAYALMQGIADYARVRNSPHYVEIQSAVNKVDALLNYSTVRRVGGD